MKTAVSIPDDIFAQAERLARRTGVSRSRLVSDAVREYVARHATDELAVSEADFAVAGARRLLIRSEW